MASGFELVVAGGTKIVGSDAIAWARHHSPDQDGWRWHSGRL
jgi:hypothetical protein